MKWSDLTGNVWTIPAAAREKSNAGRLELTQDALDIINAQPRIDGNPYVFVNAVAMVTSRHLIAGSRTSSRSLGRLTPTGPSMTCAAPHRP